MRLEGRIEKVGKYWVVEIPALAAHTQGRSLKDAYAMAVAWVRDMFDRQDLSLSVYPGENGHFELGCDEDEVLIALVLRRQREGHGLTLAQVAKALGQSSKTAYARYEQGKSVPTVGKLRQLLQAVGASDLVLRLPS